MTLRSKKLVKKFEQAAVNLAFIGSQHPDEHPQIRSDFKKAKMDLNNYIENLEMIQEQKNEALR